MRNPAISLWIRYSTQVEVLLLATDTTGQTLQFPIRPGIENAKAGDWQYVEIPIKPVAGGRIGRLVEAGILVEARNREPLQGVVRQGVVSFDDFRLRESSDIFHVDPASATAPPPSERTPSLGVNIHRFQDDPALDLARDAGFSFVRMDMYWADIEKEGRYNFAACDELLRALEKRGMGVLWILDYGHPDHGGKRPLTPQDIAAFARFAEATAMHFKGRNVRYEIWNEPNAGNFWPPAPNGTEYATLLREAAAAIRKADPDATVSSGGVYRFDEAFLTQAVFTQPANSRVAGDLTAIGVHPYAKDGPETIATDVEILRDRVAHTLGQGIGIWDTEWGYSSTDTSKDSPANGHTEASRNRQAVLAVREVLTVWALGFPVAVWYDLRDDGTDPSNPENNYGLLDSGGNTKPAMTALRTLTGALKGRQYTGIVQDPPAGIHAMRWIGPKDTVMIVWTDRPGEKRKIEFAKRDLISATSLLGGTIKLKDGSGGLAQLDIDEGSGPIYLQTNREP
jgi:arabinogalactan endo-1,4-beta-galactosidase